MFSFFKVVFCWWHNSTFGTMLDTFLHGKKIGTDKGGNTYYTCKNNKRRWVIYNGEIEASRIPPKWHAWLHRLVQDPPTVRPLKKQKWEKEHLPNLTGSSNSYFPHDNKFGTKARPASKADYESWTP